MPIPLLTLRRATVADIPQMSGIRLAVTQNRLSDPARVTGQMYEDFLEKDGRGWVAQIDGVTAGFCYANRLDGSIWALFVAPGHEGLGLGQGLLRLATDWLFALGFDRVDLETGAGTRADRFYAQQGWERSVPEAGNVRYVLRRPLPGSARHG